MKVDTKQILIFSLVAMTSILVGVLIGKNSSPPPMGAPLADDGKLAQAYKEKVLLKVIRENAKDLQKCYFELLEQDPIVKEGEMDVLLKIEEDGKIASAKITKDQFNSQNFAECVSAKLESYYLSPPPMGINRFISHVLAFKSEATALKEAQDRAESNKLPKILPVDLKNIATKN